MSYINYQTDFTQLTGRDLFYWKQLQKIRTPVKRQKINTDSRHVCMVGVFTGSGDCMDLAYRKVSSKYGHVYTCDACAKDLCRQAEEVWGW